MLLKLLKLLKLDIQSDPKYRLFCLQIIIFVIGVSPLALTLYYYGLDFNTIIKYEIIIFLAALILVCFLLGVYRINYKLTYALARPGKILRINQDLHGKMLLSPIQKDGSLGDVFRVKEKITVLKCISHIFSLRSSIVHVHVDDKEPCWIQITDISSHINSSEKKSAEAKRRRGMLAGSRI